jgi:hypothetical protein
MKWIACGLALSAGIFCAVASATETKVSDLSFLAGHWEGQVDSSRIEQVCSLTDPQVMVCIFRLMGEKGTEMLELYTLRDTVDGVEERIRFFSPDLKESPGAAVVTMKLTSFSGKQMVFENPTGSYPKRATLTREGDDQLNSRIELIDHQGKSSIIEAHWRRSR